MDLAAIIKKRALDAGFDLAGIASVQPPRDVAYARRWVEDGYGGEMHYLANPKRDDPRRVLPGAKSVICVALVYNAPLPYSTQVQRAAPAGTASAATLAASSGGPANPPGRGWISRYAWGSDYHEVLRSRLETLRQAVEALGNGVETRVFVDTGPIVERAFARQTGVGWMGKNTCIINQEKGSWFFLGVILTSLEVMPDAPAFDRCGSCTKCLEACPTGALTEPYKMDATRCIAYYTIESRGAVPMEMRERIGNQIFGCDICQDVGPWTSPHTGEPPELAQQAPPDGRRAATTAIPEFQPLRVQPGQGMAAALQHNSGFSLFNPPLASLASLTASDFGRVFARSPVKRAKYEGWLRNLCVAAGNSGDARLLPWLQSLSAHANSLVAEHAAWAARRLRFRDTMVSIRGSLNSAAIQPAFNKEESSMSDQADEKIPPAGARHAVKVNQEAELADLQQKIQRVIALRAYDLYEARGRSHGQNLEDWFRAEAELERPQDVHLQAEKGMARLRARVPGYAPGEIVVGAAPQRLMVWGESKNASPSGAGGLTLRHLLGEWSLPADIDSSHARATLQGEELTIEAPLRGA